MPYRVWNGSDGGVIAAWTSIQTLPLPPAQQQMGAGIAPSKLPFSQRFLLTWRQGNKVRRIGEFTGSLGNILPTASGQLLITTGGPNIELVTRDGKPRPIYTLKIEQFYLRGGFSFSASRPFYSFLQLSATQDGRGRAWIWCDAPIAPANTSVLQGFLLYDGKRFVYHRTLQGLPDRRVSYLGPWDAAHLVAAVLGDGLYLINTSTFAAHRLDDPEPNVFRVVQKIFQVGANRYVLSSAGRGPYAANPFNDFENNLWRLRNGRWEKVLAGADNVAGSRPGMRPWAKTHDGLWLGSVMRGLWFIPANGAKPQIIDWRQGFPFDSLAFLFTLPQNRLLAINAFPQSSTLILKPASLLSAPPPPGNIRLLRTHFLLQPDSEHRIWGFVDCEPAGLDEWNGSHWLSHPVPPNLNLAWIGSLDADLQGRIWLFPNCRMGPSAFFDPRQGTWHEFSSYQRALEEQHGQPLRFQNPSQDPALPAFGPDGRIAFMGPCGAVHYFNGSYWRMFRRGEIVNVIGMDDGPPFFDKAGNLKMNIAGQTWEYHAPTNAIGPQPGGRWHRVTFDPGAVRREAWFSPRPAGLVPEGCQFNQNNSLSKDRLGNYWWTWQGNIYEGRPGACKLVLSSSNAQPFIDGRGLRRVLIDADGNRFFETTITQGGRGEYVFMRGGKSSQ